MFNKYYLFHFQKGESALLHLILDRQCGPITSLLNQVYFYSHYKDQHLFFTFVFFFQSTYQEMVHELLIKYNRVSLDGVPETPNKDLPEVLLSAEL